MTRKDCRRLNEVRKTFLNKISVNYKKAIGQCLNSIFIQVVRDFYIGETHNI